jgi:hypothetical protein
MDTRDTAGAGTAVLTREQTDTKVQWRFAGVGSTMEHCATDMEAIQGGERTETVRSEVPPVPSPAEPRERPKTAGEGT